jgi:hypothetical protein
MYKYAIVQEIPYKRAETLRKNQTNLPTRLKEIAISNDRELLANFIKDNKLQDVRIIEREGENG